MTTTKTQARADALESAFADAEAYGYIEAASWHALKAAGVTVRTFRRALAAQVPRLPSATERSARDMAELVLAPA